MPESFLRSKATEKAAVVRIFIWYVTWKVATGRLDIATNCKEFCTTYSMAGMESFHASGLKTSAYRSVKAVNHSEGNWVTDGRRWVNRGCENTGERQNAIMKEIDPLRSSFSNTAVAGE